MKLYILHGNSNILRVSVTESSTDNPDHVIVIDNANEDILMNPQNYVIIDNQVVLKPEPEQ